MASYHVVKTPEKCWFLGPVSGSQQEQAVTCDITDLLSVKEEHELRQRESNYCRFFWVPSDNDHKLGLYLLGNKVGNELSFIIHLKWDNSGDCWPSVGPLEKRLHGKGKGSCVLWRKHCKKLFMSVMEEWEQGYSLREGEPGIKSDHSAGWAVISPTAADPAQQRHASRAGWWWKWALSMG